MPLEDSEAETASRVALGHLERPAAQQAFQSSFPLSLFHYLFPVIKMDLQMLLDISRSTMKLAGLSVDVVRGLVCLCERYKDAQLILQSTSAQVNALKAALIRINELAKGGTSMHHQLAVDLGSSLLCCDLLLTRLNEDVINLNNDGSILQSTFIARLKTAFNGGPASEIQAMLNHQANALTLLLTVYNCQSFSDQVKMLQDSESRQIFDQVEEDGLSLKVHRDSSSFFSETTDRLSMLSREFTFDRILFSTKLYSEKSGMLIQLLRKRMQRTAKNPLSTDRHRARSEWATSSAIEEQLQLYTAKPKETIKVLITMTYPDTDNGLIRALKNNGVVSLTKADERLEDGQHDGGAEAFGVMYPINQLNMWAVEPRNSSSWVKDVIIHTEGGLSGREEWLAAMDSNILVHVTDLTSYQGDFQDAAGFVSDVASFFRNVDLRVGDVVFMCWLVLGYADATCVQWVHELEEEWSSKGDLSKVRVGFNLLPKETFHGLPIKNIVGIVQGTIIQRNMARLLGW